MKVTLNGVSYNVAACDEHEDDASPRAIKAIISEQMEAFIKLQKAAEALGFKLVKDGPMAAPAPVQPQPDPQPTPQQPIQESNVKSAPEMRPFVTPGFSERGGVVSGDHNNQSYDLNKVGKENKSEVEFQVKKDLMGNEAMIPRKAKGETGETSIRIVDTGGNQMIEAITNKNAHDITSFKDGYRVSDCSFCLGTGENKITGQECPKCKGSGIRI